MERSKFGPFRAGDRVEHFVFRFIPGINDVGKIGTVLGKRDDEWERKNAKISHYHVKFDDGTSDSNVAENELQLIEEIPAAAATATARQQSISYKPSPIPPPPPASTISWKTIHPNPAISPNVDIGSLGPFEIGDRVALLEIVDYPRSGFTVKKIGTITEVGGVRSEIDRGHYNIKYDDGSINTNVPDTILLRHIKEKNFAVEREPTKSAETIRTPVRETSISVPEISRTAESSYVDKQRAYLGLLRLRRFKDAEKIAREEMATYQKGSWEYNQWLNFLNRASELVTLWQIEKVSEKPGSKKAEIDQIIASVSPNKTEQKPFSSVTARQQKKQQRRLLLLQQERQQEEEQEE